MRYAWAIFFLMFSARAIGQTATVNVSLTMPSVALVDILPSGSSSVTLQMTRPAEAGRIIDATSSNSNNWLIFTSAVATGVSRSIRGDVVGTLPAGVRLRLDISPYAGDGLGFTGGKSFVTSNVYLTGTSTRFIDNIQGAYTGTGFGTNGFKLKYSLEIQTYTSIRSGTYAVTVRYTMTDN